MSGFIALHRCSETSELRKTDPNSFLLLSLIAERARWKEERCLVTGLEQFEAMIGDWTEAGITTRGQYREATKRLTKCGFIATKTTNKGTVATLINQCVFSIIGDAATSKPTNEQPPSSHPTTTKNKGTQKQGNNPLKSPKGDWEPDEVQTRLNQLFNRKPSTRWSDKELRAYRKIDFQNPDLEVIERYYQGDHPTGEDYRRRDLQTLLNNWTGELDRARNWKPASKTKAKPQSCL